LKYLNNVFDTDINELKAEVKLLNNMTNTEKFTKRQSTKIIYYWLHWLNETDRLTIFNQFSNVLKMFLIVLVTSCSCE